MIVKCIKQVCRRIRGDNSETALHMYAQRNHHSILI